MATIQLSPAYARKRKMMMVFPLLVLPFITLAFWALGGGKNTNGNPAGINNKNGLNTDLPASGIKTDKSLDKLSYYEIADADSARRREKIRSDPYFKLQSNISDNPEAEQEARNDSSFGPVKKGLNRHTGDNDGGMTENEKRVYAKIAQIHASLEQSGADKELPFGNPSMHASGKHQNKNIGNNIPRSLSPDAESEYSADQLQKNIGTVKQSASGGDPEMAQIDGMLEKIMDIQHPERLAEKYKPDAGGHAAPVFAVTVRDGANNGFYGQTGADSMISMDGKGFNYQGHGAIEALVHETQSLVNGSIIKLRLLQEVYVDRTLVPKDNFVYGTVSLNGERLTIMITSIRYGHALLPVSLSACDMDGMAGIYVPGAITRDVAKQSTDNALQSIALNSLDASIGAQATSAGIETAKNLISKKVKLVRVTVKAGYHVLLTSNHK